jgi:hypothetical protein
MLGLLGGGLGLGIDLVLLLGVMDGILIATVLFKDI